MTYNIEHYSYSTILQHYSVKTVKLSKAYYDSVPKLDNI